MLLRRMEPYILIACTLLDTEFVVEGITRSKDLVFEDPEDIEKLTTAKPFFDAYGNWTDWESWEASPDVAQGFPRYRSGYDVDGLVIHVVEIGILNQRKWAAQTKEKQEEFWKSYEWWTRRQEKDATFNNNQGIVLILDFDVFAFANSASPDALQMDLKIFSLLFRQNNAVKYGFAINVNFAAESFIDLSKPLWGDILEKFEIYGTHREKWMPKILRTIDPSQLPPKYGGSKSWRPLGRTEFKTD